MYKDAVEEIASTLDIAREAGKMAKQCVLKEPRTGGVAVVGKHNGIEIILHGLTTSKATNVLATWEHIGCVVSAILALPASPPSGNNITLEDCAEECAGYQYLGTRSSTE